MITKYAQLTDAELIRDILKCDLEVAQRVCHEAGYDFRSLITFYESSLKEMGLMPAQIKRLQQVTALTNRFRNWKQKEVTIRSSRDSYEHFTSLIDLSIEVFYVMILNRANIVMDIQKINHGGVSGTIVDPRVIFRRPMELMASGIILIHNHPSGNATPSDSDIKLTSKLKQAGKLLDIQVLDHIIICNCDDKYYSFADEHAL